MICNLVGNRIRKMRAQRQLTQQQLADLAGIPRATLASVERDDSNPSLAAVHKIAVALNSSIDDLLETHEARVALISSSAMPQISSGDGHYRAVTTSPVGRHHFIQQLFRLEANASFEGKPHPPGSEEYLHLLEGELKLDVAGEEVCLRAGDSASFHGNVRHSYHNSGTQDAVGSVTILVLPQSLE